MKLLRNPIVVGVLVVVALVVVLIQFKPMLAPLWSKIWYRAPAATIQRTTPTAGIESPAAGPAATPSSDPIAVPELPAPAEVAPVAAMDRSAAWTGSIRWAESPKRDPFHGYTPPTDTLLGPFAKDALRLHGVWRQTASTLAVINNKVVAEGDSIQEFRVEAIEQDAVWVVGPRGQEKLEFILPTPPASTEEESVPEEAQAPPTAPDVGNPQ